MLITGFDGDPLVQASIGLMSHPAFWAVHTAVIGSSELDDLEETFAVDRGAIEELESRLFAPDNWPVFTLPLKGSGGVHVIYRNLDGDTGLDYVLTHPDWPQDLHLAAVEGCFIGPGLSWPELTRIAEQPPDTAPASPDTASRLLLLLPALGDADLPGSAVQTVASALAHLTSAPDPHRVAKALLHNADAYWQPAIWQQLTDGALVCDEPHSRRCPGHQGAFTPEQAIAVTRVLST